LKFGTLFNHIAELVAPWFVFWPRIARSIAGIVIITFQLVIILSGNLSFLNWITIVPALACFDDRAWSKILPRALTRRAEHAQTLATISRPMQRTAFAIAALVAVLSVQPLLNVLSAHQIMNTSFDPLDLVNTYGAFGAVGKERFNVVFEGTDSYFPDETATWKPYPYKGLPVALDKQPPQIAPYQLHLDWQMWFAAMGTPNEYPWTLNLIWKLLHNDPGALSLFASNPFPDKPPRYIRAVWYRYKFLPAGNREGKWWERDEKQIWLPPLSVDNSQFVTLLRRAGWIGPKEKP
jgi:Lipase maturation factor